MEITFVAETPRNGRVKRPNACESCKKRKKRCTHDRTGLHDDTANNSAIADAGSRANKSSKRSPLHTAGSPQTWRFVGDLNPESVFQSAESDRRERADQDNIGVWQNVDTRESQTLLNPSSKEVAPQTTLKRAQSIVVQEQNLHASLASDCLKILPPLPDQAALLDAYFAKFNDILPILHEPTVRSAFEQGNLSPVLLQAVCIVAAKEKTAASHLRLSTTTVSEIVPRQQFCHVLYEAVKIGLQQKIESDKLIVIRTLALISMHGEGPDGAEESSLHLMQAVHHAHTMGLHLGNAKEEMQDSSLTALFWSLWSLDRLNACINGRPVMMNHRDIGIQPYGQISSDHQPDNSASFRVWLQIAELMGETISLYRPSVDPNITGWEEGFPDFEEIVSHSGGIRIESHALSTLELFYHSVSILSCRTRDLKKPNKPTASATRQALSALRIVAIVSTECPSDYLIQLPIVPYSLSLALSVAYKQLRQTRLPSHITRSLKELETCCQLLEKISETWWSAGAMAKLGRKAVIEASKRSSQRLHGDRNAEEAIVSSRASLEANPAEVNDAVVSMPTERQRNGRETSTVNGNPMNLNQAGQNSMDPVFLNEGMTSDYLEYNSAFEGIDQLLGDYLDLNLPLDFGDPLFEDVGNNNEGLFET